MAPYALITRRLYVATESMRKTFKYRLYPNKRQQRLRSQQLEECRWLYNESLAARRLGATARIAAPL